MITIFNFNEAIKYENVRLGCPFFFAYVFSLGKQRKNEECNLYTPASSKAEPPLSRGDFAMFIIIIYLFLLASILKSSTSLNSSLLVQNPAILFLYFFPKSYSLNPLLHYSQFTIHSFYIYRFQRINR